MTDYVSAYTDGLRAIADFLDAHPALVSEFASEMINLFPQDESERVEMIRALTDGAAKGEVTKDTKGDAYLYVSRRFGPHTIDVNMTRDEVCEAVQVGTRTVTKRDPNAPLIEVEEPVIEWKCRPLLAEVDA